MADDKIIRKLTTILAADVVGYSSLMGVDEEATVHTFRIHRQTIDEKITQYRGRVFGGAGDSVIAEFASPVEAVRCAVELQRAIELRNAEFDEGRRMRFRVGINLGDVMIDGDDLLGDGVNVAARLEALAEPGGICLSEDAYRQVRGKLKLAVEDAGLQRLKNIAEPVRVLRIDPATAGSGRGPFAGSSVRPRRRTIAFAAGGVLATAAAATGGWLVLRQSRGAKSTAGGRGTQDSLKKFRPDRPSIAVLPFANLTGKAQQNYFVDGITEDIVNTLGRYRQIAVLAFNAAKPHRNSQKSPAAVGRALGVRYIVVGSVRRSGDRVRVSARLVQADRGEVLWSNRFDAVSGDIFAVQDKLAHQIAGTLIANVRRQERRRAAAKPTDRLDAYDMVLRGRVLLLKATRRDNRLARGLFEKAIGLDQNYALAYAWLARAHYLTVSDGWTEFPVRSLKRAETLAQRALSIDPDVVEAHRTLGRVYAIQFQYGRAITEIDQAIRLNPSDAEAHGDRGLILLYRGELKDSATALETAFLFDPNLGPDYFYARGLAYYSMRRHDDAVRVLERGAARYPSYVFIAVVLVATYGQLGRLEDARRNVEKVKGLMPIFDAVTFGTRFKNRAHYSYLAEGLRKGGFR